MQNAPASGTLQTGWLKKRSETFKRWKPKFFVLANRTLTYYEDENQTKPKGTIPLEHVHKMKPVDAKKYGQANCFELVSASTIYALSAETPQERDAWMAKIESNSLIFGRVVFASCVRVRYISRCDKTCATKRRRIDKTKQRTKKMETAVVYALGWLAILFHNAGGM